MTAPTTPAADASLHDLIMNLPTLADHVIEEGYQFTSTRIAYKSGHRDARHAAAELATARESALVAERNAAQQLVALNAALVETAQMLADKAEKKAEKVAAERDSLRAAAAVTNRLLPILSNCLKHQQVNSASEIMRQIEQELAALAAPAVEG